MNLSLLIACHLLNPGQPILVLKGLDPIELAQGKEVAGSTQHTAVYCSHEYRFASKDNLARFKTDPIRHAVQTGGACGKMGALTGKGAPDRWAVVDGKIFLFASDGCRETFLKNKDAYFKPIPKPVPGTAQEILRGKALFKEAGTAHGLDKVTLSSFEWAYATKYKDDGREKLWWEKAGYFGPQKMAIWSEWDAGRTYNVVDGKGAFEGVRDDVFPMHPDEARAVRARVLRHPLGILVGSALEVIRSDGPYRFVVRTGDIFREVWLDPKTKRIDQISYTDRRSGPVSDVETKFSDYTVVGGVWVPRSSQSRVDGGDWKPKATAEYVKVNGPAPDVFGMK
ncbi:MAG: hypothetical protein K1X67_05590 [Fimbriimonadaceae bacterium]|nr:hypothetical protein [Fimbriimonadaceae bacterium]